MEYLSSAEHEIMLRWEIDVPYRDIGDAQLKRLREINPQMVILDLGDDPDVAFRFSQYLVDQNPGRQIIGVGPALPTDALMQGMRSGLADYLVKPVDPDAMTAAIQRARRKLGSSTTVEEAPAAQGTVIAVFSAKGGAGATTVATNLAVELHRTSFKATVVVDTDLQMGESAAFLGVQPRFDLVDFARSMHRMDKNLLASYVEPHESGVHLVAGPYEGQKADGMTGEHLRAVIQLLRQHYDFVVLDSPATCDTAALAPLTIADQILIVTAPDLSSLRQTKRCLPVLSRIVGTDPDRVRLVVNRYAEEQEISRDDVERTLGLKVFATLAADTENAAHAINTGKPIALAAPSSRFVRDVKGVATKLAGITPDKSKPNALLKGMKPLRDAFRRFGRTGPTPSEA